MPFALEVLVVVGAWLMRSVVRCFGGGSVVFMAMCSTSFSLLRVLHARWASRHLLRSKAAVSQGEAEWLAYAHAPVDERTTLLWLPGGAFISHDAWELSVAKALLPRLAERLAR